MRSTLRLSRALTSLTYFLQLRRHKQTCTHTLTHEDCSISSRSTLHPRLLLHSPKSPKHTLLSNWFPYSKHVYDLSRPIVHTRNSTPITRHINHASIYRSVRKNSDTIPCGIKQKSSQRIDTWRNEIRGLFPRIANQSCKREDTETRINSGIIYIELVHQ